jgi:predicted phosphodiesterase
MSLILIPPVAVGNHGAVMRIVLLGDIHVYTRWAWPWQLLSKRALGMANLWVRRQFQFQMRYMDEVVRRAAALGPDMVLLSGDLTTTALPIEFRRVRAMLAPLFENHAVFVVPGNHDRYTFGSARRRVFEKHLMPLTAESWPNYHQVSDSLHLISLDPNRPNLVTDRGLLPPQQMDALRRRLETIPATDRVIVLCHYGLGVPPGHRPEAKRHAMINAAEVRAALAAQPHEVLFLHGHQHEPWCWRHADATNVVSLNAGAPVMVSRRWPRGQGFWEIDTAGDSWAMTHHVMDAVGAWHADRLVAPTVAGEAANVPTRG